LIDPLLSGFEQFVASSLERPGTSRHVDAAGIRIHYLEWEGPQDAPVLLLLHGYLAHAHWWDFVAPWLATQYRVVAPDFGGMGDSGTRPEYSYAQFFEEVTAFLDALGIRSCVGIGHSFGGRALLYACHARPDLFTRAIVVDSRLGTPQDPVRGFDEEWRPKKRYPDQATILRRFLLRPLEPAPALGLDHMGRMSVRQEADGQWTWKFDENVTKVFQQRGSSPETIDDAKELRGLRMPVDFVYGEESRVVTPERAVLLRTCLPDVRSVIGLPASHHHLPVSQPVALVGVLRTLLAKAV
jgi:pimeloyl-ACP methyl ester carboxylesterase